MELALHPKQMDCLRAIERQAVFEVFFGGAAGGGKSHLLRALAIIWCMRVPGLQVYLFRRLQKDLLKSHMQGPTSFPMMLQEFIDDKLVRINYSNYEIIWANNSKISLSHIQYESDLDNYLSQEIHVALFDEASTFLEKMYRFIRARVRLGGLEVPEEWKSCLPFIALASNPRGPMHLYLKRGFVDASVPQTVFEAPRSDGGGRRIFIPSFIKDNPTLTKNDPSYVNRLEGMGDPEVVKAYLEGDWSAVEGAALPMWKPQFHVLDDFDVTKTKWKIKRCYDYGFSAPYSVLWIATSNGEEYVDHLGRKRSVPKGSVIVVMELYGDDGLENGLKEQVAITARKILTQEILRFGTGRVKPGPADNSIFSSEQGPSISQLMAAEGVEFVRGDKSPGSRVNGLAVARKMLDEATKQIPESPCLYVFKSCKRLIEHLPNLQTDSKTGEDVDTDSQPDHDWDSLRYGLLDSSYGVQVVKVTGV